MSRATHARFLRLQAERRAAELNRVIGWCAVCGAPVSRLRLRLGDAVTGEGAFLCRGCNADLDC